MSPFSSVPVITHPIKTDISSKSTLILNIIIYWVEYRKTYFNCLFSFYHCISYRTTQMVFLYRLLLWNQTTRFILVLTEESLITSTCSSQKSFVQPRDQVFNSSFRFLVQRYATLFDHSCSALVVQDRWRPVIKLLVNRRQNIYDKESWQKLFYLHLFYINFSRLFLL